MRAVYKGRTIIPCEWTLVKYDSLGRQVWAQRERAPEDWAQFGAIDMVAESRSVWQSRMEEPLED
ncbi:MAG TPA: hypothetical protein VKU00_06980 [Chthonomonadaceae bacterium]|nr:hypothetical protein [Chthonomonadaceae bacterium]